MGLNGGDSRYERAGHNTQHRYEYLYFGGRIKIQFAYGRTNFVGGIAASRPHRRTDSTVRPTPGTTDVRILVV